MYFRYYYSSRGNPEPVKDCVHGLLIKFFEKITNGDFLIIYFIFCGMLQIFLKPLFVSIEIMQNLWTIKNHYEFWESRVFVV